MNMKQLKSLFVPGLFVVFSLININCGSSAPASALPFSKESTCVENISGKDYKYLAYGIGEDNASAETDALKCALWSAMVGGGAGNCVAIMNVTEKEQNKQFLEDFFRNDSEWTQYVRSSNQGRIDPDKRIKLSNGKIKLGVEAIVSLKVLRETLQARGIIGGMKIK